MDNRISLRGGAPHFLRRLRESDCRDRGLPAERKVGGVARAHRLLPAIPPPGSKALHPPNRLCMFNLTPGATLGFTDRMKFSRLFVDEEGMYRV